MLLLAQGVCDGTRVYNDIARLDPIF